MTPDVPRILVLGAGLLHRRHYRLIRRMGCFTIAMDRNPQAPAADEADAFCCEDPTDTRRLIDSARCYRADAILPLAEFGVVPAAEASEELGLRQIPVEVARNSHDKLLMRQAWDRCGVSQPHFRTACTLDEAIAAASELGFPLILKPRALSAARGVRFLRGSDELAAAFDETSHLSNGTVLMEQAITGVETSVEGVVIGGRAMVLAVGDKELRPHRHFRVTRSIQYPGAFSDEQVQQIEVCAQAATAALGLMDSPFHLEVFVCGNKVFPIEIGARGGGGHIWSDIVELVSGVNLLSVAIDILLGRRLQIARPPRPAGACYRFLFSPEGQFHSVSGLDRAWQDPSVVDLVIALRPGDRAQEPENGTQRMGYIVTRGATRQEAYQTADRAERALEWAFLSSSSDG